MLRTAAFKKRLVAALAAVFFLAVSGCSSRVVIGRAAEPVAAAKPSRNSQQQKKAEAPKPAPASAAKPEEKPRQKSILSGATGMGGGMGSASGKSEPLPAPSMTAPQSTPKPEPPATEQKPRMAAPFKLDLSFGSFGLGVGLFDTPVGVAVDEQENMYVVDQGNYRIQKFDRFGIFQFAWGRQGMGDGEFSESLGGPQVLRQTGEFEFNKPIGILLDRDDRRNLIRIHVADSLNHRIERFLLTQNQGDSFPGTESGFLNVFIALKRDTTKTPPDLINVPDALPDFSDGLQEKYRADRRPVILDPLYLDVTVNQRAFGALSLGLAPFVWGGLGYTQGQLNMPSYLAKDENNIFYVSDTGNGRVQAFYVTPETPATDASFFREFGNDINLPYGAGRLKEPTGIAYDNTGFGGFLVIDKPTGGSYNIQRFDRDGRFTGVFASSGDKEGQFKQPVALAINTFDSTVFITDRAKRKIMVYNNKGEFMYEFGGEELADPRGITVLRNNYVYVTDAAKNMVYRYVPQ